MNNTTIYMLPYGTSYGFLPRYTTDIAVAREWMKAGYDVQIFERKK